MRRLKQHPPGERRGLTLIELLVVMVLLTVLITLTAVYVIPAFRDNKNVQRGVDQVITSLLIAKQRSLRDQAPRGLRFLVQPDGTCTEIQYIEQPDPYRTGTVTAGLINGMPIDGLVQFTFTQGSNTDLYAGAPQSSVSEHLVQPGDFFRLEVGTPANYLITQVPTGSLVQLSRVLNPAIPVTGTQNFRIIRQPRPLVGEDTVKLPTEVVLDFGHINAIAPTNQVTTRPVPGAPAGQFYYEVLFDPSGGVMNRTSAPIVIWARQLEAPAAAKNPNTNLLIAIYPRTGLVASHPVDPVGTDPLGFAKDGRSSGM